MGTSKEALIKCACGVWQNLSAQECVAKAQAYFVYVKLLQRTFGGKVPPAAAGAFNQCFLRDFLQLHFPSVARRQGVEPGIALRQGALLLRQPNGNTHGTRLRCNTLYYIHLPLPRAL